KESRPDAQKKMDSQLIYELKMRRGNVIADGVWRLETAVQYNGQGKVSLDLNAKVSDVLLNRLMTYGADIVNSVPEHNSVRIQVDIDQAEAIASLPDVFYVQPEQRAMTSRVFKAAPVGPQPAVSHDRGPGFDIRAAKVRSLVSAALLGGTLANAGAV